MASPLPKTTAPAAVKNQRIFHRSGSVAGPPSPASSQCGGTRAAAAPGQRNGVRTSITPTPERRKIQRISFSVQPVTTALMRKTSQRSRSRASVILSSLTALRAITAITAAPIP